MDTPRFLPDVPFPPYTYVPGRTPHPVSDPAGHMYGEEPQPAELLVEDWPRCRAYLRGIDLFNHGYYWEAHEVWEALWHAAGRTGPVGEFLKGLIKLAAAGVKTLEGSAVGRARHARRAADLFRSARTGLNQSAEELGPHLMGLSLPRLMTDSEHLARLDVPRTGADGEVRHVLPLVLRPGMATSKPLSCSNDQ